MSREYSIGLAFGIFTALLLCAIVWKFSRRKLKGTFDERQELVRGRGYKYACFTLLILMTLDLLAESWGAFDIIPVTRTLAIFFIILAGVMVYAIYCIRNDSYFGIGTDSRTYRAVMWIVIVCNAISGFAGLREGAMTDGKLDFNPCASILFCAEFLIIMISISIKQRALDSEEMLEEDI